MGQFAHIVRALQQFDGTVHVPERFVVELHALIHAAQSEQQFAFFGLLSLLLCQLDGLGTDADAFFVFVQAVEGGGELREDLQFPERSVLHGVALQGAADVPLLEVVHTLTFVDCAAQHVDAELRQVGKTAGFGFVQQ